MRIISGALKGRRIKPPAGLPVRPTTDMAKESLFNILMSRDFTDDHVLDLFAGTAGVSLEFISRGCHSAAAVEQNQMCIDFIHHLKDKLQLDNLDIIPSNVFRFIPRCQEKFDIVFADPPYDLDELETLPDLVFAEEMINADGIFILEHDKRYHFNHHPHFSDHRRYGKVEFSFFKPI
ncbi:MAG: RsmD family RNA methyltransferase [Bacteroidota bacterium]